MSRRPGTRPVGHALQAYQFNRPWYYNLRIPPDLDIAILRPPRYDAKGRNKGFETAQKCIEHDRQNIAALQARGSSDRSRQLADKLETCVSSMGWRCGSSACKRCMREFRRTLTGLALPHARRYLKQGLIPVFVTVVLTDPALRRAKLAKISLGNAPQWFRMLLRRKGLGHVPMVGGFEIDYSDTAKLWEPHGHFVAFLKHPKELDSLKRHFKKKAHGVKRRLQIKPLDPKRIHEAIVYCWKFSPMKKLGYERWDEEKQIWKAVTRKVRLPNTKLRKALLWLDDRDPTEFIFLQTFKLVRSKLIPV